MRRCVTIEKAVGQTPLECMEAWRQTAEPALRDTPLTYAGRLDPMASGTLLILIGDECKRQDHYRDLDKAYEFSVLFGVTTDTADVLGLVNLQSYPLPSVTAEDLNVIAKKFTGSIELPYPQFSSKTVAGKPLHTWTLEGRINEIAIPTKTSIIYQLHCTGVDTLAKTDLYDHIKAKIELVTPVTDPRKSIGNDFRRPAVRSQWHTWAETETRTEWQLAHFRCIASSGTYMRTLAEVIAKEVGTVGLAYSIHRTTIGTYQPLPLIGGYWKHKY